MIQGTSPQGFTSPSSQVCFNDPLATSLNTAPLSAGYGATYAKSDGCLLVSWVLMGQPYPVIEQPLQLKGRVAPFDSHYVIVDQRGYPCNRDTRLKYDEIVVFSKSQVLPRIIFHFQRSGAAPVNPISMLPIGEKIPCSSFLFLCSV